MSSITFVKWSGGRLAKSFGPNETKDIPSAKTLSSREVGFEDITQFHEAIEVAAVRGDALFTGRFPTPLNRESRAGKNDPKHKRNWICVDVDDLQGHTLESLVGLIHELKDVSYCYHYSNSHGLHKQGLNAHIFFLVDTYLTAGEIQTWLEGVGFMDALAPHIKMSVTANALNTPIDASMAHVARLIYIAPPVFEDGCGLVDPLKDGRYGLVIKDKPAMVWAEVPMGRKDKGVVSTMKLALLNSYRDRYGLSKVAKVTTGFETTPVTAHGITLTTRMEVDMDGDRKVVRCDLSRKLPNGEVIEGDRMSWWFDYDYITDSSLLKNFKGEPPIKLQDSLPEFAAKWNQDFAERNDTSGDLPDYLQAMIAKGSATQMSRYQMKGAWEQGRATFMVDIDRNGYIGVRPDHTRKRLIIEEVNRQTAANYANAHNITYDPKSTFDLVARSRLAFTLSPPSLIFKDKNGDLNLNTAYIPDMLLTERDKRIAAKDIHTVMEKETPILYRYLKHGLTTDAYIDRFVNWVAAKVRGVPCSTAWLLRGMPGSGKSSIVRILGQLLTDNDPTIPNPCMTVTMSHLLDDKNGWLERAVFIEGAEFNDRALPTKERTKLKEFMKVLIDAPEIPVRKMGVDTRMVRNNTAWIFTSNEGIPFELPEDDRRYETPMFVKTSLASAFPELAVTGEDGVAQVPHNFFDELIAAELPMLGEVLMSVDIETTWLKHSASSKEKTELISAALYGDRVLFNWIRNGDLDAITAAVADQLDPMDQSHDATLVRELLGILHKDPTVYLIPRTHATSLYKVVMFKNNDRLTDIAIARAYTSAQMPSARVKAGSAVLRGFTTNAAIPYCVRLRSQGERWQTSGDNSELLDSMNGSIVDDGDIVLPEFLRAAAGESNG